MPEVEFYGEKIRLRDGKLPYAVTLKFARAASGTANPMDVDATVHWLLERYCVLQEDWNKFWNLLEENDAEIDDLMPVIMARFQKPVEDAADRPTGRSSDSSDGPTSTPVKSGKPSVVTSLAERFPGRPEIWAGLEDLAKADTG